MGHNVFISMGSTATKEQREFVDIVLDMLKMAGLSPRIMNENEWSHEQPLKAIKKVMKECNGAVIIAFSRTMFKEGVEIRKDGNRDLIDISLPTPWNHIEASMAYSYDLPLLVVAEKGLKSEGLIEQGYDWRVYWTDIDPRVVKSESFKGYLGSWKTAVDEFEKKSAERQEQSINLEKLTIGSLIKSMTIPQLWKMLAAFAALLSAIAVGAYKIGGGKWPWE